MFFTLAFLAVKVSSFKITHLPNFIEHALLQQVLKSSTIAISNNVQMKSLTFSIFES